MTDVDLYSAYVTTQRVGGVREQVFGERIVIDLGEDKEGNLRELSVDLVKRAGRSGLISVYSIFDPRISEPPSHIPTLSIERGATNSANIAVRFKCLATGCLID